jgi:hypothetical protein
MHNHRFHSGCKIPVTLLLPAPQSGKEKTLRAEPPQRGKWGTCFSGFESLAPEFIQGCCQYSHRNEETEESVENRLFLT